MRWVSGCFDPLLAEHIERLQTAQGDAPLGAVVLDSEEALLPSQARAELVAGLASVAFVVISREPRGVSLEDSDLREQFLEHVRARHNGAGA